MYNVCNTNLRIFQYWIVSIKKSNLGVIIDTHESIKHFTKSGYYLSKSKHFNQFFFYFWLKKCSHYLLTCIIGYTQRGGFWDLDSLIDW